MKPVPQALILALILVLPGLVHAADIEAGRELARHWCATCHLVEGAGEGTDAAPAFKSVADNPSLSDRDIKAWLSDPHPPMPNFNLSRTQIDDLTGYIRSLAAQ